MNSILQNVKMRVEKQTKTRVWEDSSLCPETSAKNAVQELRTTQIAETAAKALSYLLKFLPRSSLKVEQEEEELLRSVSA